MEITPVQKKYLIGGSILLLLGGIYYFVTKDKESSVFLQDPTGTGTGTIPTNGIPYVFNAKNVATELHNLMKQTGWTKGMQILEILDKVNAANFVKLYQAFGKRPYNNTTYNNLSVWGFDLDSYDLKHWLRKELSEENYQTLRLKYINIL